jgi:hypothetical protein
MDWHNSRRGESWSSFSVTHLLSLYSGPSYVRLWRLALRPRSLQAADPSSLGTRVGFDHPSATSGQRRVLLAGGLVEFSLPLPNSQGKCARRCVLSSTDDLLIGKRSGTWIPQAFGPRPRSKDAAAHCRTRKRRARRAVSPHTPALRSI